MQSQFASVPPKYTTFTAQIKALVMRQRMKTKTNGVHVASLLRWNSEHQNWCCTFRSNYLRMKTANALTTLPLIIALLATPEIATAYDAIPFTGSFSGTATEQLTSDPSVLSAMIVGAGNASPIGPCSLTATHSLDTRTLAFTNGRIAFSGKRGTIGGSYSGQFYPTSSPGIFTFVASLKITGGAGKFRGAKGRGMLSGTVNSNTIPELFTASVDAVIQLTK